jgi:hypothetical protein
MIIGKRYGKLTVIERGDNYVSPKGQKGKQYICLCDCGVRKLIRAANLKSGGSKSCGCSSFKHGWYSGSKKAHPLYRTYQGIVSRCMNTNSPSYHDYGGRGITICSRWLNKDNGFQNFISDVGARPEGHTLDRINVNAGYEPSNVRWATSKEQARNTRCDNCDSLSNYAALTSEGQQLSFGRFKSVRKVN